MSPMNLYLALSPLPSFAHAVVMVSSVLTKHEITLRGLALDLSLSSSAAVVLRLTVGAKVVGARVVGLWVKVVGADEGA